MSGSSHDEILPTTDNSPLFDERPGIDPNGVLPGVGDHQDPDAVRPDVIAPDLAGDVLRDVPI